MKKKKRSVKVRRLWKIKPMTKVKDSVKHYLRTRAKEDFRRDMEDE